MVDPNDIKIDWSSIDKMKITNESLSDLTAFIENPDFYLEVKNRKMKFQNDNSSNLSYAEVLHADGLIFASIVSIGNELVKVNAYTEAIRLYTSMIDKFTEFSKDSMLTKDDIKALKWSIAELKEQLMSVISDRDEYTSKRKGVLGKYSDLLKSL